MTGRKAVTDSGGVGGAGWQREKDLCAADEL